MNNRVTNKLTEVLASTFGRRLYKHHLIWANSADWASEMEDELRSCGHPAEALTGDLADRRFNLMQLAKLASLLKGSSAECGVMGGVGSFLICKTLESTYSGADRHYAFDSFEGLADPTDRDLDHNGRHWWKKGDFSEFTGRLAGRTLKQFSFAELTKGWIPEVFSVVDPSVLFRFVHIDVDLYEATRDSLRFFYPRLVSRGIILLDDYGFESCLGARDAADEFFSDKRESIVETATGPAFVIKQ